MSTRHRTRQLKHTAGSYFTKYGGVLQSQVPSNFVSYDESCDDVADNPGVDHPLSLTRYEASPGMTILPVNGVNPSGPYAGSGYDNYFGQQYFSNRGHVSISNSGITGNDVSALLARTNPSRPVVTPLTLIQDVVDIPRMLKDVGRLLKKRGRGLTAKDAANHHLAAQFGWLPLIDDLHKLWNLADHISGRIKELDRLYSGTGLKRRMRLGEFTAEATDTVSVTGGSAQRGVMNLRVNKITRVTKWGTVRWTPTVAPPLYPDLDARIFQARRVSIGLTPEGLASGAWDLIPWTWLTDWFADVGSFMLSHSNTVPARATGVNLMRQTETVAYYSHLSKSSWLDGGTGYTTYVTKTRSQNVSAPLGALPFVGLKRLSILGSLFVQRFK